MTQPDALPTTANGTLDWSKLTVLVTGGTGSFGQALVKLMLARHHPKKLIVFSRDELKQSEMERRFNDPALRFFIGDVRDEARLRRGLDGVDIVVHAAALKQVPITEYNPLEAIKTNVLGAANVIDAAIDREVRRVVALSSDKAVNPVNLYGATKLCADKLFVAGNAYSGRHGTRFSCVRYGNVVASRGSVIPLFLERRQNGILPITDPRMTRFWITLEQGVELVLRVVEMMHGGEIFVPKIPSMNIMDLAKAIAPECKVHVMGIRPGEKLHERLISRDEARNTVEFPDMFVIQPTHAWWNTEHWTATGRPVPDGFQYGSDTNPQQLSIEALRELTRSAVGSVEDHAVAEAQ